MKILPPQIEEQLADRFGKHLQFEVPLAGLTTAKVGGNVNTLITINTADDLAAAAALLWTTKIPFRVLGAGSNMLFSDLPHNYVILLNKAKKVKIDPNPEQPKIFAESGANLGMVARKAALAGISGMEWAATIPGTVGGAVYGNAGAHGGDVNGSLFLADILQQDLTRANWSNKDMAYTYRSSILKQNPGQALILSATFTGTLDDPQAIQERMQKNSQHRRKTQPPGASMGSMFKNPEGDYAGRLIEAAGLKGRQVGGVKVSEVHANFFVNAENATAEDIWQLVQIVQDTVYRKFDVKLHLEVEPIGFVTKNESTSMNYRGA